MAIIYSIKIKHGTTVLLLPLSGNYMYFEASSPAQQGQTNCFYSQDLPVESCRSLTFWYHMLGSGIGALRVKLQFSDGTLSTIWEKKGEQGNQWIQASVEIKEDSQYKVEKLSSFILYVSGKLSTNPSLKPTLTLTSHFGQNVGLREG